MAMAMRASMGMRRALGMGMLVLPAAFDFQIVTAATAYCAHGFPCSIFIISLARADAACAIVAVKAAISLTGRGIDTEPVDGRLQHCRFHRYRHPSSQNEVRRANLHTVFSGNATADAFPVWLCHRQICATQRDARSGQAHEPLTRLE